MWFTEYLYLFHAFQFMVLILKITSKVYKVERFVTLILTTFQGFNIDTISSLEEAYSCYSLLLNLLAIYQNSQKNLSKFT